MVQARDPGWLRPWPGREQRLGSAHALGIVNRTQVVQCQEERGAAPGSVSGDSVEGDAGGKYGEIACTDPHSIQRD